MPAVGTKKRKDKKNRKLKPKVRSLSDKSQYWLIDNLSTAFFELIENGFFEPDQDGSRKMSDDEIDDFIGIKRFLCLVDELKLDIKQIIDNCANRLFDLGGHVARGNTLYTYDKTELTGFVEIGFKLANQVKETKETAELFWKGPEKTFNVELVLTYKAVFAVEAHAPELALLNSSEIRPADIIYRSGDPMIQATLTNEEATPVFQRKSLGTGDEMIAASQK